MPGLGVGSRRAEDPPDVDGPHRLGRAGARAGKDDAFTLCVFRCLRAAKVSAFALCFRCPRGQDTAFAYALCPVCCTTVPCSKTASLPSVAPQVIAEHPRDPTAVVRNCPTEETACRWSGQGLIISLVPRCPASGLPGRRRRLLAGQRDRGLHSEHRRHAAQGHGGRDAVQHARLKRRHVVREGRA